TGGAVHQPGQVQVVVTGVVLQARPAHPVEALGHLAGGVLDGADLRVFGEPVEDLIADRHSGAAGDVVEHRRQAGGLHHCTHVPVHALLRGTVVVRGDHQQAVGAGTFGSFGDAYRVRGVIGAGAGDDHRIVADLLHHSGDQFVLLGLVG